LGRLPGTERNLREKIMVMAEIKREMNAKKRVAGEAEERFVSNEYWGLEERSQRAKESASTEIGGSASTKMRGRFMK